jgi:GAF domain-containing protein
MRHRTAGSLRKVLEYEPDENRLMVRAGVGWAPGTIDAISLAADIGPPAGYAYQTGASVISNHLEGDTRFRTPRLLAYHGVRRAINVLIEKGGEGKAFFGVLEVDSADPGQFDQDDANFLAGFAGLLGVAIERQQADAGLQEALKHQALLTREMSHRVKNSLTSVVGLLRVQLAECDDTGSRQRAEEAELFARLAEHFKVLADELEKAMVPNQTSN